jgi:type II secretory pathway component PulF
LLETIFGTWTNITLPKVSDIFSNNTSQVPSFAQLFTYAFVYFFGSMFWGAVILTIAGALYMKSQTALPAVAWLMCAFLLSAILFPVDMVIYIGLLAGCVVGYLMFQIFVAKR